MQQACARTNSVRRLRPARIRMLRRLEPPGPSLAAFPVSNPGGLLLGGPGSARTHPSALPRRFEYYRPDPTSLKHAGTRHARRLALGRVNNTAARELWRKVEGEEAERESVFFPTSVMNYLVRPPARRGARARAGAPPFRNSVVEVWRGS